MMHGGGRRLLHRPQRRRRLFTVAAGGVIVLFIVLLLLPTSAPSDETPEARQQQLGLHTLKPPATELTQLPDATHAPLHDKPTQPQQQQQQQQRQHPKDENAGVGDGDDVQQTATHPETRIDGLFQMYGNELSEMEALDLFKTRPGEARVSFEHFAACLATMLDVDPVARTEVPRNNPNNIQQLPLLISVTAGNTQDLKAMICNLTVPYKYIVLAQTGDTPEMTPFFNLLRRVFGFTSRLVVHQFKESIGFAGAVNAGLREMLRHPFDEVPFVHIVHNDVRYLHTALEDSIKDAYMDVAHDKAVIALLEAELKTEPNADTPLIWQPNGLRAPITVTGDEKALPQLRGPPAVLVTSPLLPDRVRYMADDARRLQFDGHLSFAFHNSRAEYTAVYLSRLAVLTVGFFDENFYPIMFEDTDYRWRANMLGFSEMRLGDFDHALIAFDVDCTNTPVDDDNVWDRTLQLLPGARGRAATAARDAKPQLSPATKALMRECAVAFARAIQFSYMAAKWGVKDIMDLATGVTKKQPYALEAFSGKKHLPLDAWVVDTRRIAAVKNALRDTGVGWLETAPYNPEVILEALQ